MKNILYIIILSFLFSSGVFAEPISKEVIEGVLGVFIFVLLIAYFIRGYAIGGWLFLYYFQLFVSIWMIFSLNIIPQAINDIETDFNNREDYGFFFYTLFLLLSVIKPIVTFAQFGAATILLFRRNENTLKLFRKILYLLAIVHIVNIIILYIFNTMDFPIYFDIHNLQFLSMFLCIIWAIYFLKSKRVQKVFVEKSWVPPKNPPFSRVSVFIVRFCFLITLLVVFFTAIF